MLDRIHLPDIVRPGGGEARRRRLAARRRRRFAPGAETALQRAFAGQVVGVGVSIFQVDEEVAGAPGRRQFVKSEGLVDERGVSRLGTMIDRLERRFAAFAELAAQASHGSFGQAQFVGDIRGLAVLLDAFEDESPQILVEWCRHGSRSVTEGMVGTFLSH